MDRIMTDSIWDSLSDHRTATADRPIIELFNRDDDRFERFTVRLDDMILDFSKTALDDDALKLLLRLAEETGVSGKRDAMFAGEKINTTEDRAVLHTALRAPSDRVIEVDGANIMPGVSDSLNRMTVFADGIRSGAISAPDGKPFTDVINIGIGGSDLGPLMVTKALAPYHDGPRVHFVSNVDGAHLADTLRTLDPHRTLVIVASKTFTTIETMTNAQSAKAWLSAVVGAATVGGHFAAISSAGDKAQAFGIEADRVFGFEDWVGGRYSLWGPIGLSIMLATGPEAFRDLLAGADAMDSHFRTAPLAQNMPVLLALVGIWHRNICAYPSRAVLPYDQRLARLPAYLQQLDMESNGKRVTRDGTPVSRVSGPVVWGEPGTNGQHAFYQLIHQGTDVVPCEFLVAAAENDAIGDAHHILLLANCLAQSEALLTGQTLAEARAQSVAEGAADPDAIAPHRVFPGNRPSTTLLYRKLDPQTLGKIIALYEHRVFVEGAIWDINSFDQWGVELGKKLAGKIKPLVEEARTSDEKDGSTNGLIQAIGALRKTVGG
jgi:glucose-6-phosphate isomerase